MTAPSQLCPRDLNQEGVRIQVEQDIHSILHNKILPQLKLEGNSETNPAASCNELLGRGQNSGYYWIHANGTSAVEIYCDMNRQFWWLGVCSLPQHDRPHTAMSRSVERSHNSNEDLQKSCSFQHKFSCIQHFWDTLLTIVCVGQLLGTNLEHLKHFGFYGNNPSNYNLGNNYVDGVSVTYGQGGQRRHIWTFVGAKGEYYQTNVCTCTTPNAVIPASPPWVGTDYFCETGMTTPQESVFYSQDPLWDGQGCGPTSTCCSYYQPPWFCKQLSEATSENIEVRLMTSASATLLRHEDTPIELMELYIQ